MSVQNAGIQLIFLFAVMWVLAQVALVGRAYRRVRPHGTGPYYFAALVLIILLGFLPFMNLILSAFIARKAGCTLNEAEVHRCIIHGHDYGETLYEMGMGIWLLIFTVPLAEAAVLVWAIILTIHLVLRHRRGGRDSRSA